MSESSTATAARIASVPIPGRLQHLPRDHRGYPVPRFVLWAEGDPALPENERPPGVGVPYFPVMSVRYLIRCVSERRCWVCGEPLETVLTFVVGPMCLINLNSSEPPSHLDCARYSARICPFLTLPNMRRMPQISEAQTAAGMMIKRNPGVTALILCARYKTFRAYAGGDGILFEMGAIKRVEWYCRGRPATRCEVLHSIDTGLPALVEEANKEGRAALEALRAMHKDALRFLPS